MVWRCTLGSKGGASHQEACSPYPRLSATLLRVAVPLHFTLKFKSRHGRIFWKGAKMKRRRRGSVWKEQMDYFFLSWRMRSAPGYPSSWTPPQRRMRNGVVGGYLRRGNRGCGSAPNSGLRETSGPRRTRGLRQHSLSTTCPAFSEPWRQWRQPRLNSSSSAGTFSACCCR